MAIPRLNHGPRWQGWTFGWEHRPQTWVLEMDKLWGVNLRVGGSPLEIQVLRKLKGDAFMISDPKLRPRFTSQNVAPKPRKSQNFVPGSHLKTSPPEPGKSQKVNLRQSYNIIQYVFTLISKPKEDTPKRVFGSLALYYFGNTPQLKHI